MKRVLAIILSLMISVCFLPVSGIQAEEDNDWIETESPEETEPEEKWDEESVENGWAGKQATCTVSKDGTLTVKGKGSVKLKFTITGGKTEKHIRKVVIKEGITRIADYGTSLDKAMKICLPRSLVTLGYSAFSWNHSLVSLCLPDGIRKLPGQTFYNCKKLKRVHLPKKLCSIGEEAFKNCKNLKTLKIPDKVTSIGKDAFKNCKSLETLVLPQKLNKFEADFVTTPMLHKVVNRSNKWIPLDSAGGKRIWKVDGKKVTKLAPRKTAVTKGARYRITYALSGGKAKGKLPKYYYYGKTPQFPDVQKKGYTFLGWRSLKGNLHIPQKFPAERGDDIKLTAMLIQLKVERISETIVKFTIKDSIKWDSGGVISFLPAEDFRPEYAVRIFTRQPTKDNEEEDKEEDSCYGFMKPGGSCVFRDLKPDKKYYFEITFRWNYLDGDDYDSTGHYSGWHLRQEVPDWDGIVRPEPPEENKDDDDEYELYPPETPKEEENKPITAVSDFVQ